MTRFPATMLPLTMTLLPSSTVSALLIGPRTPALSEITPNVLTVEFAPIMPWMLFDGIEGAGCPRTSKTR